MTTPPQTPGWYPDPDDPENRKRYWNGTGWAAHTEPLVEPSWLAMNRNGLIAIGAVVGGLLLLSVFSAIANRGGDDAEPANGAGETAQPTYDQWDFGCEKAAPETLKDLARGATAYNKSQGLRLTNGWWVKSDDYRQVYFVAARIPSGKVAVFKVNSDPLNPNPGASFKAQAESVNGVASDNFTYPYAPLSGGATMKDDGARDALDCAEMD